ncbi:MAG: glycosyltransferase [Alphaproteobacteria bacterium]|nr:glycosyltransferase [Alphaproteobacteria bacterium]
MLRTLNPGDAAADPAQDGPAPLAAAPPRLAIVLPVYKHSVLVTEAIRSALEQTTPLAYRIVIVNDGCAFRETHEVALSAARAHPDRVVYLRRPNGGLSAARNTGIDYVTATWPTVEAIYFLDADNRLYPQALERAWAELQADPGIGWVYPDFDMFGQEAYFGSGGDYSVLKHLNENYCEAGSLVRRSLFDKGLRFDESMRLGFEDWDFWLQAVGLGYRGRHGEAMGLRYRKRPESMLANSERDRAEIIAYMRRKHKALYQRSHILAQEQHEAPRYAICLGDTSEVLLTTDARVGERIAWAEFIERFGAAWADPQRTYVPPFMVFTTTACLAALEEQRVAPWTFWRLEDALGNGAAFASMVLGAAAADSIETRTGAGETRLGITRHADLVMVSRSILQECVRDTSVNWLTSLAEQNPLPPLFELQVQSGDAADRPANNGRAVSVLLRAAFELREVHHGRGLMLAADWRPVGSTARCDLFRVTRELLQSGPVFPRVKADGERHVGFILPLASFAGVEKVATNLARGMKALGWTPHLFLFAAPRADNAAELREIFATINFLDDPKAGHYDPSVRYFGTVFNTWTKSGDHGRAIGLLAGMDAVINAHSADAHAVMGSLKRLGVKTVAHLHLVDRDRYGEPAGFPYQVLAYEHSYDAVLVISKKLQAWAHAMGVPEAKLVYAPNAASYQLDDATIARIMDARAARTGRLRIAYIGRFDRQKGLDRLAGLVKALAIRNAPVEWRIVGGSVLAEGAVDPDLAAIEAFRLPPTRSPEELTDHLAWADVLVMPSYFEGVPLMLLEALRVGVVPVATRVGAVHEVIDHAKTGYLVESGSLVATVGAMLQCITGLIADRALLRRLAGQAHDAARAHDWAVAARAVGDRLDTLARAGARPAATPQVIESVAAAE